MKFKKGDIVRIVRFTEYHGELHIVTGVHTDNDYLHITTKRIGQPKYLGWIYESSLELVNDVTELEKIIFDLIIED